MGGCAKHNWREDSFPLRSVRMVLLVPNSPEPGYDPVQSNSLGVCEIKDELSWFFLKTPNRSSRAKDLEVKLFYVSFGTL